jgi:hypothetical protein
VRVLDIGSSRELCGTDAHGRYWPVLSAAEGVAGCIVGVETVMTGLNATYVQNMEATLGGVRRLTLMTRSRSGCRVWWSCAGA